ncbi:MAG: hypothetical protein AAF063_36025, partial [Cyanobacteria bacterium J06643_5]
MNEKRQQEYLELVEKLINSSSDEELKKILTDNLELLDTGFLRTLNTTAQMESEEGDEDTANFLRDLANVLTEALGLSPTVDIKQSLESLKQAEFQPYGQFLAEVLQATVDSQGDAQVVYLLLAANVDKLDVDLAEVLRLWATNIFEKTEENVAESIGFAIGNFSNLIRKFPLGNTASNMEIAITGYEVILTIFTKDTSPQDWAMTQNNLGIAYSDRIKGDKADNIELAINCFQDALNVRTRNDFPQNWAMTQNNLGAAYKDRIKGDKADNIELAINCFQDALNVRTRNDFPQNWAMTQNNLGAAYKDRIKGDKADNIELAINCFQDALN